jgi:hypothetical protein
MSTNDLIDIAAPAEDTTMDSVLDQSKDHQKDELMQEKQEGPDESHDEQYQFDVIVIGSGPGGGYVY